jgi:hypothetical protein
MSAPISVRSFRSTAKCDASHCCVCGKEDVPGRLSLFEAWLPNGLSGDSKAEYAVVHAHRSCFEALPAR